MGAGPRPTLAWRRQAARGSLPGAQKAKGHPFRGGPFLFEAPGSDLLLHGLSHTTIGAGAFHIRVRDGIEWFHTAIAARETFGAALGTRAPARMGTWDVTLSGQRARCVIGRSVA